MIYNKSPGVQGCFINKIILQLQVYDGNIV